MRAMEFATVKSLPAWRLVREMKRRHVRQTDVAARVGCDGTFVNHVIHRRRRTPADRVALVWATLATLLDEAERRAS